MDSIGWGEEESSVHAQTPIEYFRGHRKTEVDVE
jgi:hypothetical protein